MLPSALAPFLSRMIFLHSFTSFFATFSLFFPLFFFFFFFFLVLNRNGTRELRTVRWNSVPRTPLLSGADWRFRRQFSSACPIAELDRARSRVHQQRQQRQQQQQQQQQQEEELTVMITHFTVEGNALFSSSARSDGRFAP